MIRIKPESRSSKSSGKLCAVRSRWFRFSNEFHLVLVIAIHFWDHIKRLTILTALYPLKRKLAIFAFVMLLVILFPHLMTVSINFIKNPYLDDISKDFNNYFCPLCPKKDRPFPDSLSTALKPKIFYFTTFTTADVLFWIKVIKYTPEGQFDVFTICW